LPHTGKILDFFAVLKYLGGFSSFTRTE